MSSTEVKVHGIPFTTTKVRVMEVLEGRMTERVISISQLGGAREFSDDTSRILARGAEYMAFLRPLPQGPSGRYEITGDQGLWMYGEGGLTYVGLRGADVPLRPTASQLVTAR